MQNFTSSKDKTLTIGSPEANGGDKEWGGEGESKLLWEQACGCPVSVRVAGGGGDQRDECREGGGRGEQEWEEGMMG